MWRNEGFGAGAGGQVRNERLGRLPPLPTLVLVLAAWACGEPGRTEWERRLRAHLETVPVVDCHEHIRPLQPDERPQNFYTIVAGSYLHADLVSAGAPPLDADVLQKSDPVQLWESHGRFLELTRQTTYYRHLLAGFRRLYDYPDDAFTPQGIDRLSDQIARRYADRDAWFAHAFRQAGFEVMFLDKHWDPWNPEVDTRYFRPVFNITALVTSISRRSALAASAGNNPFTMAAGRGDDLRELGSYLRSAEDLLQQFQAAGAVAIKNTLAYSRTLRFEEVTRERAETLFRRDDLSPPEVRELEDFLVHWLIERSIAADLPIQIHTGYLASNRLRLDQTDPMLLNNLFIRYPRARFVLFHGGYPWTSQVTALAKMFPNVHLDLVWLPQITKSKAMAALDEMLDTVPYNKLFWGGDCHYIEESVGSLEVARDVVAATLAARIARGDLSESLAREIATAIFWENARRFFGLTAGDESPDG